MIDQIPVWFWWFVAIILIAFVGFLIGIISWFLVKYVTDSKESWVEVKGSINKMTDGITDLITITKLHEHRINQLEKVK